MTRLLLMLSCALVVCSFAPAQEKADTTKAVPTEAVPAQTDTAKAVPPPPAMQGMPDSQKAQEMPPMQGMEEMEGPSESWNIVVLGGWTIPFEPDAFKNEFKPNYNFGGGIACLLPPGEHGYGELSFMLHYYNLDFNEPEFRDFYNIPAAAKVYGYPGDIYTAFAQFRGVYGKPNEGIGPYFTAAFGAYHIALPALGIEGQSTPVTEEYEKTTVGWSVGLGCDIAAGSALTVFVDGKFVLGVTETNGHKLFTAGAGVRYKL